MEASSPPPPASEEEGGRGVEVRAFLLDLDGTLVDSEPYHKRAEVLAFSQLGLQIQPDDLMHFTGMTLGAMLEGVEREHGLRTSVDEFLNVQQPIFIEIIEREVELFPDAIRFLEVPRTERLAIVTSSLPWYVEIIRRKFPILEERIELLVCAADVESGKPHPEPFQLGARRLGLEPADCVAVEDSVNGVRSAKTAGCFVCGMDRERHGRLADAHRVVATFDEVP